MKVAGSIALVTGANRGLGLAFAKARGKGRGEGRRRGAQYDFSKPL
jgi:NAD(P)-dependent dehydrogenase (short-subunit alcohol dehydrogenase family)